MVPDHIAGLCLEDGHGPGTLRILKAWLDSARGDANDLIPVSRRLSDEPETLLSGLISWTGPVGDSPAPSAIFALLLSRGARWLLPELGLPNMLIKAVLSRNREATVALLLHGADPRLPLPDDDAVFFRGITALHGAVNGTLCVSPKIVALLLKFGADPNARISDNVTTECKRLVEPTVLLGATKFNLRTPKQITIEVIRLLLDAGADLDARNWDGLNAEDRVRPATALPHHPLSDRHQNMLALLTDVREAGSWRRYVNQPRVDLMVLLRLCSSGRALPPADFYTRLRALPSALTFQVLSFWRTPRDAPGGLLDDVLP